MGSALFNPPLGAQVNWSHPLAKGLVGRWLLNEGAGCIAQNIAAPSASRGIISSGSLWYPSKFGKCIKFDGASEIITTSNVTIQPQNFTVSAWFRSTHWNGGTSERVFEHGPYPNGVIMGLRGGGGFNPAFIACNTAVLNSSTAISDDQKWHHLVGTYSAGTLSMYMDGLFESSMGSSDPTYVNNNIYLGSNGASGEYLVGDVCNISFYNRELSATEIRQLYTQPFADVTRTRFSSFNASAAPASTYSQYYYQMIRAG